MPTTFECLNLIKQKKVSHQTISLLYNSCYKIALITISKKYSTGNHIFINNETTLESIAADAIAPLFISTNKDNFIGLQKSLTLWESPITNEAHADFFLHKIVWNRVSQHITHILKETDPIFRKIHSSLKHIIEKKNYNRISYFGVIYITKNNYTAIAGNIISNEEIENLHCDYFKGKLGNVLESIFEYLEYETTYCPAIPLNAVVRKLKLLSGHEIHNSPVIFTLPNFEENIDIYELMTECLEYVYDKLDKSYSTNSKIDNITLNAYKLLLKEVSEDMKNGGIGRGLYDSLNQYLPELTKEEFYKFHHSQINYLINLLKKAIRKKIAL